MQSSRLSAVATSVLLFVFALTGIVTYFAMDRSDYSFCEKRLDITIVALIALVLLVASVRIRGYEESQVQRRLVRAAAYMLVVAVSGRLLVRRVCHAGMQGIAAEASREAPAQREIRVVRNTWRGSGLLDRAYYCPRGQNIARIR